MEDKKANIIATLTILTLLLVIIAARVYLKLSKPFYLLAGVDISLILAVFCFLVIRSRYNRERKNLESRYISEGRELRIEYSFLRKVAGVPTKFKLEDLEEATDGFRVQIGKGGSGSVFKGVLKDGSQVAVKRIEGEEKGEREFRSEKMRERRVIEIVDQRLIEAKEVGDEGQVMKLVCVALWCIQEKAKNRPDMATVIEMLEGRVTVNEPPDSKLVVVDLLAAAGGGDDDVDDVTTGVRRVVEMPKLHIQRGRHFRFPSVCSSIISPVSPRRNLRKAVEFGKTHVVRPKGKHQATIVWLHGLGDNGSSWSQILETLPLPNIKWICPTAPSQPISLFGGFPSTAWFDVVDLTENGPDDVEGLDVAAAHVANLLANEPADIKLGVGGFSMGAGTSLYSATCFALGKYGNGNPYPVNLSAVIGLSGWLPCAKTLTGKLEEEQIKNRAASLPILVCHGKGDDVVPFKFGEKSSQALLSHGFKKTTFKAYGALGHYTIPQETEDVCAWLTSTLGLEEMLALFLSSSSSSYLTLSRSVTLHLFRRTTLSSLTMSTNLRTHAYAGNPLKSKTPKSTDTFSPSSAFESLKALIPLIPNHPAPSPDFKVLPFSKGRPLVFSSGGGDASTTTPIWHLGWISLSDCKGMLASRGVDMDENSLVYLGPKVEEDLVCWAVDVSDEEDGVVSGLESRKLCFVELRTLMVAADWVDQRAMDELAIAGHARALLEWHNVSRFCGSCGGANVPKEAGRRKQCSNKACGKRVYPRVDPVVIMLVIDRENDRALLSRQSRYVPRMWSCLAGFIEPGESLEEAVRRETWEETGIEVGDVVYHSSQPWPVGPGSMPCQLMLGFFAFAKSLDINVDKEELEDAQWHSREDVKKALAFAEYRKAQRTAASKIEQICKGVEKSKSLTTDFNVESGELAPMFIPGPFAIAHHLISTWVDQGSSNVHSKPQASVSLSRCSYQMHFQSSGLVSLTHKVLNPLPLRYYLCYSPPRSEPTMATSFFRRLARSAPIAFPAALRSQIKSGHGTFRFSAGAIAALSGGFSCYYLTSGNNLAYLDQAKEETGPKTALNPDKWLEFKLQDTATVSHNTKLFRFSFDPSANLGLHVASCLLTRAPLGYNAEGKTKYVVRPYTPISDPEAKGYFDLLIKVYPDGKMSQHFASLKPGDVLEVKGPIEKFKYSPNMKKHIGMIAGGSGITPMLQVIDTIVKNPEDNTKITLLYANVSPDDILLKQKLDSLQANHPNLKVFYTVDNPTKNWKGGVGYVSKDMALKGLPLPADDTLILVCGPPGMMEHVSGGKAPDWSQGEVKGILKELGFTEQMVFKF
ncbi:hypothetical protein IGI04_009571 [Brassica rapa subsp. trilocularis]|uniref:NAD(+) diphosphatase n=1 Tax=Brassica rapa subsp. trilocularis TaxID=1813537 RepID=A0ABQ7MXM8_BRACM|nr:hypothetical protein IGI04_009571 [Brassica rapa subsp. trilocularis]